MSNQTPHRVMTRPLGHSGLEVSALGLGCWAIGGPFLMFGSPDGWGDVDDDTSIQALRRAFELGVNFFDTADAYGTGHSESVLGKAFEQNREQVVIATKFGFTYDEARRELTGTNADPAYVRQACEASLRRLNTDYIDLYQLHVGELPASEALAIRDVLEELVTEGSIRWYGWSTDSPDNARLFADGPHCVAIQNGLNVFEDAPEMLDTCSELDLASVNRSPLAMGVLTGKFDASSRLPADDVRGQSHEWLRWFENGRLRPEALTKLDAVREILRSDGRSLTQGALGWIWGRGAHTVPIPGFKTVAQVEENAGAMAYGPLKPAQLDEIDQLLGRS